MGSIKIILAAIMAAAPAVAAALIDAWQKGQFNSLHGLALLYAIAVVILGVILHNNHKQTNVRLNNVEYKQRLNSLGK